MTPEVRPEKLDRYIDDLEKFFNDIELPVGGFELSPCETITDMRSCVDSHLGLARANNDRRVYTPYLLRMKKLREILKQHNHV